MLSTIDKSRRNIIISITLIIIAIIFILYGSTAFFKKEQPNKEKEKEKPPTADINKKVTLEENEIQYGEYIYTLPDGWKLNDSSSNKVLKIFNNTVVDGVTTNMGAYISTEKIASTKHTKEEIFKDATFFRDNLKKNNSDIMGDGFVVTIDKNNAIVFPYINDKKTKLLLAYMPAYEGYFYDIQFFSNKVVGDHTETFYNFDDLDIIFNFLNTRREAK